MNYRTVSNTGNASPYLQMPPKITGVGAPEASIDERIRSALRFIPVGSHDVRVRVAFMLKSALGEDGREIWDVWREGRGDDEANSVWRSASESGALTIGSLFHEAKANGWRDDGQYRKPSLAETAERKRIAVERAAKQAAIDARRRQEAASLAHEEWAKAQPCLRHPYTVTKCIRAHGTRFNIDSLMVPLRDADGAMHSMQYIRPNGDKKFMPGGRVRGCFYLIGVPENVLCIAEGFATGASVHEATGHAVAVAFNAGNLLPVAIALRSKYPDLNIIICADDDHQTPGNPGLTKAKEAARQVGGLLAVPKFGECRQGTAKDFNDMHVDEQLGLDAVRACIASAKLPDEGGAIEAGIPVSHHAQAANDDTQSCSYGGGRFETSELGVFFIGTDKDGNEKHPIWVCSPLRVVAMTRDGKSGEWGRLLEWRDADGVRHQWAMPLELTQGDGSDVRRELARFGVQISPSRSARDLLASYIQVWPVEARARCVDRLGWHGGVYVTPSESIGQHEELVVFQNAQALEPSHAACGTVGEWRNSVGRLAAGNSRLVFALSVAFAGALADVAGEDSGGFHLRGKSSSGKSTALKVAASAWGNPAAYPRLWRATSNGLEGLAALHNDGLLILDELSQMEPKEAGESAYLLANGQGKARAS